MASRAAEDPLLSVVVALYNEEACIRELIARIDRTLEEARCRVELVLVDDGSTDRSFAIIEEIAASRATVRGLRLARNEGHQQALMYGIACSRGDVVVTLDADLQHPPEHIPAMLEAWRRGYDVVHMQRREDSQSPLRAVLGAAFYALFNVLSDVAVSPRSTDFRLLDRACIAPLESEWRKKRFLRAAARRLGVQQTELAFDVPARFAGASSYTIPRLVAVAARAVLAATAAAPAVDRPGHVR